MAGGSDEHNAIMMQLGVLCANRCTGNSRVYPADQRFWIAASGRGRYIDGSIICGAPAHPAHDAQASTNPAVVVEVLSPSREGDDQGDKRQDFQSLSSLQAYVVVAQDERRVEVYRRTERGEWRHDPDVYRDGESFELPTLASAITVTDVQRHRGRTRTIAVGVSPASAVDANRRRVQPPTAGAPRPAPPSSPSTE